MGSTCFVISEGIEYIRNSKGKWLPKGGNKLIDPGNYYTKQEVDNKLSKSVIPLTENEILAITLKKNL